MQPLNGPLLKRTSAISAGVLSFLLSTACALDEFGAALFWITHLPARDTVVSDNYFGR
jgi:hypothetical protein